MTLTEYAAKAAALAIYSDKYRRIYPVLGLIGEAGEFRQAMDEVDKQEIVGFKVAAKKAAMEEAGDCLWYIVVCCRDFEIRPCELFQRNEFDECEDLATQEFCILNSAVTLAERVKKLLRDDNNVLSVTRCEEVRVLLSECLFGLINEIQSLDITLDRVAELNLEKLTSRQERGVLTGDGDNR